MAIKQTEPPQAHEILKANPDAIYSTSGPRREFAQSHPAGAINIPVVFIKGPGQMEPNDDFLAVAEQVLPKDKKLVVGCMAGGRSQRACEILEEAGYRRPDQRPRRLRRRPRPERQPWWWPDGATRVCRFPLRSATTPIRACAARPVCRWRYG